MVIASRSPTPRLQDLQILVGPQELARKVVEVVLVQVPVRGNAVQRIIGIGRGFVQVLTTCKSEPTAYPVSGKGRQRTTDCCTA